MAEQTFRSPNFFDREVDLSAPNPALPSGIPAGVIGTANQGPAFVPITFPNFSEFTSVFGSFDPKKPAIYAANQFLNNRNALTFLRVLGAGANSSSYDINYTNATGRVVNAGMVVEKNGINGGVSFLVSQERATNDETYGMPLISENDSIPSSLAAVGGYQFVRAMLMLPTTSRVMIFGDVTLVNSYFNDLNDLHDGGFGVNAETSYFKLVISSSLGSSFSNDDGLPGIRVYSASLDPSSNNYVGKILNSDTNQFNSSQHVLYAHFPLDTQVSLAQSASILTGSSTANSINTTAGNVSFQKLFGMQDTRYTTARTPAFISQPMGNLENDLFYFESLSDGAGVNSLYKISIANIKMSVDETSPYGSFSVQVRDWNDNDVSPNVLEQFNNCDLNPFSPNFIARVIGDRKITYNFDADIPSEKRVITSGLYNNQSKFIRVVVSEQVTKAEVPKSSLPFGFRGPRLLKTTDGLIASGSVAGRLVTQDAALNWSPVLPPIPYRFKVTRGPVATVGFKGNPGKTEAVNSAFYWGVKFERNTTPLDSNISTEKNQLIENLTKFYGVEKMDALLTGSSSDLVNNNKFTLARVALPNKSLTDITSSVSKHLLGAAYIRNGVVDANDYRIYDADFESGASRVTFASLLNAQDASYAGSSTPIIAAANFNRFAGFMKYTTFMYGGFDGMNILDQNSSLLNDKFTSFDSSGGAQVGYVPTGFAKNQNGVEVNNSAVASYLTALDIMTDPYSVNNNLLAIPGIKEPYITDYAGIKTRDYGLSMYVMDIPSYDDLGARIYDDSTSKPNIEATASTFESRQVDNNYVATYYPEIFIDDSVNRRRVKVPASVAALSSLGFNDRVAYPWFAPAGFNRAALDFVTNVAVRLNVSDRDRLYDARINPIATFPRQGFVIYGQKTLQFNKSALDRVNVRRLMLEIKRIIIGIAQKIVFEQNTADVRNRFVAESAIQLGLIQAQAGVEAYQVVMNESNNTQDDVDNNRLRGRIVVVPTRAIEFIAIDFIVTNSGVQFA